MPQSLIDIAPLQPLLQSGHLILTPNSRLKNKLIQAYNHQQNLDGKSCWHQPRVFAIRDWLTAQYDNLLSAARIDQPGAMATGTQLQQLWLKVIDSHTDGLELINPLRLASDANSAYATLQRWNIDVASIDVETDQQAQFVSWAQQFEADLQQQGLITLEQLQQKVNQALKDKVLAPESQLVLLDFDEITPLLQTTLDLLCAEPKRHRSSIRQQPICELRAYSDKQQEVTQAALWAQQRLTDNPEASIGIIVPNLGQERELLARHLTEVFEPQYLSPETSRYTLPFNFSTGIPLGQTPIIQTALSLLRLNYRNWDLEQLIELLHSPFLAEITDIGFTESLCNGLLQRGRHQVSTQQLRSLCQQLAEKSENGYGLWLSKTLQQAEDHRRRSVSRQTASRWAEFFLDQLQIFGWPGQRRVDSNEFQQVQQLYSVLDDFSRIDELETPLSLHEAFELLSRQLASTPYQAQTPESPIQILGALEGAGLLFNHCWVMGMNHREWPPAPQPNPLLPLSLQREQAMPHADAERELRYAEALTQGYQRAAAEVVFSYAKQGEESHQQASPLLNHLTPIEDHTQSETAIGSYARQQVSQPSEWYHTDRAPQVSAVERSRLKGGSQILRNQAINPMAAFLIHRLGARQPTSMHQGLTPQQRGQMLHEVLANLWNQWQRQSVLLQLSDAELQSAVHQEVEKQALALKHREPGYFSDRYIALEIERLSALIQGWLEQEKLRPGFTVHATEQSLETDIEGLPLTLRLDRLDLLDNGQWLIIDYKTGNPHLKSLGSERPEEPQLPIYAIAYEQEISALLFVQINTTETTIKGIGTLSDYHEGVAGAEKGPQYDLPDNWPETLKHWQQHLEALAREFQHGDTQSQFKTRNLERFYDYLAPMLRLNSMDAESQS